jgi:glycosyltransferase involved in cell wall biosynthesis
MGAKIILDIHDIVPELYSSKFKVSMDSLVFKALVLVEKASCAFADHIIIANHIWHKRVVSRSVSEDKCSVVMNYPVTKLFGKCPPVLEKGQKFRLLYPGTMSWHQGIDIAIKAFAVIKDLVTDVEFHIYGDGAEKCNLQNLVLELGLQESVIIHGGVSIDKIALIMADAGIGIEPKRNDPFSGDAFSTKILEFMMLGIPVIASRTRVHSYYFNDSVVQFFDPDDVNDLAKCMLSLITDKNLREQFTVNARTFSKEYSWDDKKDKYLNLVDSLTEKRAYPFLEQ